MANFSSLKQAIQNYIKENGNKEITGNLLQEILLSMVLSMGDQAINGVSQMLSNEMIARENADGLLSQTLTAEQQRAIAAETKSVVLDGETKTLLFKNAAGQELYKVSVASLISNGLVDVEVDGTNLVMTFHTESGDEEITIPIGDIFSPSNYYTKTQVDGLLLPITTAITNVSSRLNEGYIYLGVADPETIPTSATGKFFYIATQAGTYHFMTNGDIPIVISSNGLYILSGGVESDDWYLETIAVFTNNVQFNNAQLITSGGVFNAILPINDLLRRNYMLAGVADTTTIPTEDTNVFYLAGQGGTYTHFLNGDEEPLVLPKGFTVIYRGVEDDGWNYWVVYADNDFINTNRAQALTSIQQVKAQNNMMGKAYAPAQFSGLGKKMLAKNIQQVGGVDKNVMTQAFFEDGQGNALTNTVFVIQYDYDINDAPVSADVTFDNYDRATINGTEYNLAPISLSKGQAVFSPRYLTNPAKTELVNYYFADEDTTIYAALVWGDSVITVKDYYLLFNSYIEIPQGCTLKFDGGCIKNGAIKFNDTNLELTRKCFDNCLFGGDITSDEVGVMNFGPKLTAGVDDSMLLNSIISICNKYGVTINFDFDNNLYIGVVSAEEYPSNQAHQREIILLNNTHIKQTGMGWLTLQRSSYAGGVVASRYHTDENITTLLDGVRVDGNNIVNSYYGENGIGCSGNIKNCIVKNCKQGAYQAGTSSARPAPGYGGKGIIVENRSISNAIESCRIYDCSIGFCYNRDKYNGDDENVCISNCIFDGCDIALAALGQSENGQLYNSDNLVVTNCVAKDCLGTEGIVVLKGTNGIQINNLKISGKNKANSIIRGTSAYGNISLLVAQRAKYLFDCSCTKLDAWAETGYSMAFDIKMQTYTDYLFGHSEDVYPEGVTPAYPYKQKYFNSELKIFSYMLDNILLADSVQLNNIFEDCQIDITSRDKHFRGDILSFSKDIGDANHIEYTRPSKTIGITADRPSLRVGCNCGYTFFDISTKKLSMWDGDQYVDLN